MAHQLILSVPATPAAVTTARHQAVKALQGWKPALDDTVMHTAALVISELVTNAVRHASAHTVSLTTRLIDAVLRIEVCDSSPVLPQPGLPKGHSENGRGLFIVAALADRYGAEPTPTGKRCWAEITVPTGPTADRPPETTAVGGTGPLPADAVSPRHGYWCECWTEDLDVQRRPALLASIDTYSAAQSDRWVAAALRAITPALDSEASDEAWSWLYEGRIETRRALLRSEPCTVSITQGRTRITWTVRPVLFVPLAHRQGVDLPACAYDFKPHAAY